MQQMNSTDVRLVSGGAATLDAVDLASTVITMNTFSLLTNHALRIANYPTHSNIYTAAPVVLSQILGGYVGYNIGQYIKG